MNEIAMVKKEIRLAQWAEMVRNRNESGLTVTDWCKENGINLKTYYYRLKRIRQAVCNEIEQHDIVPVEPTKCRNYSRENRIICRRCKNIAA